MPKKHNKNTLKNNDSKYKNDIDCVRYTSGRPIWRANAKDPYIYISFSVNQLYSAYGDDTMMNLIYRERGIKDLGKDLISTYSNIIKSDWIDKLDMPIKFLPPNTSARAMRNKNICFIIDGNLKDREIKNSPNKIIASTTLHLRYPENFDDHETPSRYKIIMLPNIDNTTLTNGDIREFKHEFAHALEQKHFKQLGNMDVPPYCQLTCDDTIMAYRDDCPSIIAKEMEITENSIISAFDPDPEIQAKIRTIRNAYPTKLGPVDIAAMAEFKKTWNARNKNLASANRHQSHKETNQNNEHLHEDLYVESALWGSMIDTVVNSTSTCLQFFNDMLDDFVYSLCQDAAEVVNTCPSYFKSTDNLWTNSSYGLMFKPNNNSVASTMPNIASNYTNLPALAP